MKRRALAAVMILFPFATPGAAADHTGQLFPQPFQVEHSVIQVEPDGSRFETEPVVDTYAGSWIVSQRPDGSRLIVDVARRELTEVWPEHGSYAVLGFDRFADLRRRLATAEQDPDPAAEDQTATTWRIETVERPVAAAPSASKRRSAGLRPFESTGARHFVVRALPEAPSVDTRSGAAVEVWVQPSVRLGAPALDALDELDRVVGGSTSGPPSSGVLIAAARRAADGAFMVRTTRSVRAGSGPDEVATLEDVTHRLELLESLPAELLEIPDTYTRTAHPLEVMVEHAESEAELRRLGSER